jgi:hypothetical protein
MTMAKNPDSSAFDPGDILGDTGDKSGVPDRPVGSVARPTDAQRRYLERGLTQPGGKLPLFDPSGREIPRRTVEACIAHGWAERWAHNPMMPDWLVCRLTSRGVQALGQTPAKPAKTPDSED